jgi:hypothetical protein
VRDYLDGPGQTDDPAAREDRIRTGFEQAFALLQLNLPNDAFAPAIDGLTSKVLRSLDEDADKATQQANT